MEAENGTETGGDANVELNDDGKEELYIQK